MRLLPIIICCFVFINLTLSWHKCTKFSVEQYLCNSTDSLYITNGSCSVEPKPNCVYDNAQSLCICKYLTACRKDVGNSYRLLQLNYSISLQLDSNNKQGIFLPSNLTTSYLTDVTTLLNSSLIPTGVSVEYSTWCDGSKGQYHFDIGQVLFNTTTNFTFDHNCDYFDYLFVQFSGQPIYNYFYGRAFGLYEYKGTYYIGDYYNSTGRNNYGSMLSPETNSLITDDGNFTCLSFDSTPDPPTFQDHCNKYISRSLYNDITVLVVTYEYDDSYRSISVSTNNLVKDVEVSSGELYIYLNGNGIQNVTSWIPPNITNYIHHYDHRLYLSNATFRFYHQIVLYNQNSYMNETNYFTYDDSCTSKTIYDNKSLSYLTNEFCCVEWQIAGTISPPPNQVTTVQPSQSSKTCPNGWYQSITTTNNCYNFISSTTDWFNAETACKNSVSNNGVSLVSIDHVFENNEITAHAQKNSTDCLSYYIGLYNNNNNWTWINGDTSVYRNWKSGYPTTKPNDACVVIDVDTGRWVNQNCDIPQYYICKLVLS